MTVMLTMPLTDTSEGQALFGPHDQFLKIIEQQMNARVVTREGKIVIYGNSVVQKRVEELFDTLLKLIRRGIDLTERDVRYAVEMAHQNRLGELLDLYDETIGVTHKGKVIRPQTLGQRHYISALKRHDIVFGIGPAGTGKTFLAVVFAVMALKQHKVKRIVLTRPAVEAGENLGFLPGDIQEKVDPYLRPLYDSLYYVLGTDIVTKLLEKGTIEVAPLAYMRGRTLNDAFVILDEAQNTTAEQMKMFLTRLGFGSKMAVTGDITQIDLPKGKTSGLTEAERILHAVEGIAFVHLTEADVVRHTLVQKIAEAYAKAERGTNG